MEMVTLVLQVLSAAAILVAAVVFYRGVTESKKLELNLDDQGNVDHQALRAQIELIMGEAIAIFRDQVKKLAQQNAELSQVNAWAKQLDKVNITELGNDVARRVSALRIKKAEQAIVEAESVLVSIRQDIRAYAIALESGKYTTTYTANGLRNRKEQEQYAMQYLEQAQIRLNALITEARRLDLNFK